LAKSHKDCCPKWLGLRMLRASVAILAMGL
jgi:hypothetical protein